MSYPKVSAKQKEELQKAKAQLLAEKNKSNGKAEKGEAKVKKVKKAKKTRPAKKKVPAKAKAAAK